MMYAADQGQLPYVAQTIAMPQSSVECALSFSVHAKGSRYTFEEVGKY